ncbi:MAG: ester cyclase [Actinomycetes bacterium]
MAEARELMDRATDAIFGNDLDAFRACYAPDVVFTAPDIGTGHGVENLVTWMAEFQAAIPDMTYEKTRELESGNCAVDEGYVLGTNTGPIAMPDGSTLPATGRTVRLRSIDVATVENGLISKHDFYFDQLEFLTQLGLMEAPQATV